MYGSAKVLVRIYLENDMNKWVFVRPTGQVLYTTSFNDDLVTPDAPSDGSFFVRVAPDADEAVLVNSYYDFDIKELLPLPARPSGGLYKWDVTGKSWVRDIEAATKAATDKRRMLLVQSDYTQLPDVPVADKEAWAIYRQALRDITEQLDYPIAIEWPASPA